MKKIIPFLLLGGIGYFHSQEVVYNDRLLAQISKNQGVRVASEKSFLSSYSKQKALYDKGKKKVAQIMAIHEYIYSQLNNVNSLFKQGKKVKYIWEEFNAVMKNAKAILHYSSKYPQYNVFLMKAYKEIWVRLLKIRNYVENEALKESNDYIMDASDRDMLLDRIYQEVLNLRVATYGIVMYFENAKKVPYLLHIPELRAYVNMDKMIVEDIIWRIKYFKYY